ncbi:universal stress protein [Saxibacter everestensis]|uniref:Universal stress protein n=1 Tax=Saxibacter everestensis TaxID=2909229 RepID=A0ABY8QUY1_9MICO|nr:universal stress protein [Brevibacteriaceae bacterium ZFBP1038]
MASSADETHVGEVSVDAVVVGTDGSDEALRAVAWAARGAAVMKRTLVIVHAWVWPLYNIDLGPVSGIKDSGLQRAAERVLEEAEAEARKTAPEIKISTRLVVGRAGDKLAEASRDANLVVVADRGLGGFLGLLLGSTSLRLVTGSHAPVLLVRGADHDGGPVVAGVDGSAESDLAVQRAAELADFTGNSLNLIHVDRLGAYQSDAVSEDGEPAEMLEKAVQIAKQTAPSIEVSSSVVSAKSAPKALIDASETARIIVVGSRGSSQFAGPLGSTTHALLQHAKCPVLCAVAPKSD